MITFQNDRYPLSLLSFRGTITRRKWTNKRKEAWFIVACSDTWSNKNVHDPRVESPNRRNARQRRSHAKNNNISTTKTSNNCTTTRSIISYDHCMKNLSTKLFRLTFWAMTWPTYNRSSVIIFETATNSLSFAVQDKQQLQNISEYCILWSWNEKSIHQIVSSYLLSDQVANLQSIISDHLRDSDQLTFIRGARQATTAEHLGILYPIIIEWEIYPPKCFVLPFERSSGQHQWSSSRPTANEWNTTNRIQNPSKWSTMDTETVKWMEIVKHMYRIGRPRVHNLGSTSRRAKKQSKTLCKTLETSIETVYFVFTHFEQLMALILVVRCVPLPSHAPFNSNCEMAPSPE